MYPEGGGGTTRTYLGGGHPLHLYTEHEPHSIAVPIGLPPLSPLYRFISNT